ncbi:MAG: sterol desaturase family protein [Myxococcaceae bacterium]
MASFITNGAREVLGPYFEPVRDLFWSVFAVDSRMAPAWIGSYVLLALLVYLRVERKPGEPFFRGLWAYLFPKDIYRHASTKSDLAFFAVDRLLFFFALGTLEISGETVKAALLSLSPVEPAARSIWQSALLTLFAFLAYDFGAFLWHFASHRLQVLWAFHRVHHAVEVLNPLSNYREHPVDSLGRVLTQGVLVGATAAAALHLLPGARTVTVAGLNAVYLPFFVFFNARHSHVWISFGRWWSRILSSPAQHQCHHGTAPEHIDVNYGLVLSIWDWVAGTLYVPNGREQVNYGLVGEVRPFPTVLSMYVLPFRDAWLRLRGVAPVKNAVASNQVSS